MFVRTVRRKTTQNVSVQIVESTRVPGKGPRQRIVKHMGSAPEGPLLEALVRLAHRAKLRLLEERQPSLFPIEYLAERVQGARHGSQSDQPLPIPDARKLAETKRLTMGFHEVFGALYDRLGFQKVFGARKKMAARLFRQAVLMRLAAPGSSKRACCDKLSRHHGVEVNPDKFYRMMDAVNDDRIARLQSIVSHEVRGLLQERVDVLFFDVTTLFFASDKGDDLRKKGFSKDGKPQKVQVVLALFQSVEGLPIGYELFPGSTTDVRTLKPALKALRERFEIGRVVLVADAGMLSQGNLDLLASQGWDWVVAARLRSLPRRMEAELFESQDWVAVSEDISVTELQLKGQRLVLRHSKKRAAKDVHERDRIVEKLKRSLRQGIKGSGKRGRFLKVDRDAVELDQDAIDRDACFDGLHGVWTSLDRESHPAQHIYAYYGELWRIEEGFRVLKHTMATRPIYHWTPSRVKAHIAICFVAFALLRLLRYQHNTMHAGQEPLSEARILTELSGAQVSLITDTSTLKQYLLASPATAAQRTLYSVAGLKYPSRTRELATPDQLP